MPDENMGTPGQKVTTTVVKTQPAPPPAPKGSMETTVTITETDTPLKQAGRWLAALAAGAWKGGIHAVTSGMGLQVIWPEDFWGWLTRTAAIFGFAAGTSAGIFLYTHPLPREWKSEYEGTEMDRRSEKSNKENGQ